MSVAGSQQQTFLRLLSALRPHWRREAALPMRIQALLSGNRAFGSRDRRLYRELIYTTLRYLPWIEPWLDHDPARAAQVAAWLAAETPATRAFRAALIGDWPPCPEGVVEKGALLGRKFAKAAADLRAAGARAESNVPPPGARRPPVEPSFNLPLPEWFRDHCPEAFESAQADILLARAPLWLRAQTPELSSVTGEFDAHGWPWQRSPVVPFALQFLAESDVTKSNAYGDGRIEVQDLGSQMILASIGIEPGGRWLDACAGAGGKSLQLASLLGPTGSVDAHDVRPGALAELTQRAGRARLDNITASSMPPTGLYDGVLVDTPCSGTGTWRRAPHLKWIITPAQIETAARQQIALLQEFSRRVRPGGRLVYATCSLSSRENEDVVAAFLKAQPDFSPAPFATTFGFAVHAGGFTILPARHDTDGFFVASLRRR